MQGIQSNSALMRRSLEHGNIMDAFKHAGNMLKELMVSDISPKEYYDLYMVVFEQLRILSLNLYEAHQSKKHHLADLYEVVQYSNNIVPRLYLMITVGSALMRVTKELKDSQDRERLIPPPSDENSQNYTDKQGMLLPSSLPSDLPTIKDVMMDLLEMSRGVQHATRGLFLRYYLNTMTRDYLTDTLIEGKEGSVTDSIQFILANFIEMNKLWVRLQYQGTSKEREKREQERKELRLLVGTNLVRLSQLESLDLIMYKTIVLPSVLQEILSCKDIIAQEYLMEVIVQVFQDEFHLQTLDEFLSGTAQLEPQVNVKQVVIELLDRFANFAQRTREDSQSKDNSETDIVSAVTKAAPETGIPESIALFDIFWQKIMELIQSRTEFNLQDVISLLVSLAGLSLNCYSDKLNNIDRIFAFANERIQDAIEKESLDVIAKDCQDSCRQLLLLPVQTYNKNILKLLMWPSSSSFNINGADAGFLGGHYTSLLFHQPYSIRRKLAHTFVKTCNRAATAVGFVIDSVNAINLIFGELCSTIIRDQHDGTLFGTKNKTDDELSLEWEDIADEQRLVCKLIHTIKHQDKDIQFQLLSTASKHLLDGGNVRIRFTLPVVVMSALKLASRYQKHDENEDEHVTLQQNNKLKVLYFFVSNIIQFLSSTTDINNQRDEVDHEAKDIFGETAKRKVERETGIGSGLMNTAEMVLRLNLMVASSACHNGLEETAYEFFVQAFTTYEDKVFGSVAQREALLLIIGYLKQSSIFGYENMETLVTKCAIYASRMLKRAEQARFLLLVAHLFYSDPIEGRSSAYDDGKRVLDCLQKALKLADSVMARNVNVELFVDILERYIWFFESRNRSISPKYISSLLELVETKMNERFEATVETNHQDTLVKSGGGIIVGQGGVHYEPLGLDGLTPQSSTLSTPAQSSVVGVISDQVLAHFRNTRQYVITRKEETASDPTDLGLLWQDV